MARYYFHIKDGADLIKDQEGTSSRRPMPPACKPCRPRVSYGPTQSSQANLWVLTRLSSPMRTAGW